MKKKKLKLDEIRVNSFQTDLNKNEHKTIKGGWTPIWWFVRITTNYSTYNDPSYQASHCPPCV